MTRQWQALLSARTRLRAWGLAGVASRPALRLLTEVHGYGMRLGARQRDAMDSRRRLQLLVGELLGTSVCWDAPHLVIGQRRELAVV